MKLPLQREQIVLYGVSAAALLVAAVFAWMGLGSLMEKNDLAQQLAERRGKSEVAEILGMPGGVEGAKKEIGEVERLHSSLSKEEESLLGPWRQATRDASGDGKEWSKDADKWKDMLVNFNDEIAKKSGKAGDKKKVILSGDFYLGLADFKQLSPSEDKVPALALQLSVSKRLVDLLFSAKEKAREGYPTSCTLLKLQGPLGQGEEKAGAAEAKPKDKGTDNSPWHRDRYVVELDCSPEVLYAYISALIKDTLLFVPVSISLENEKTVFPKRSQLAGLFSPAKNEAAASPDTTRESVPLAVPPLLLVLAGKEKLRVNLQIDFVGFNPPSVAKTDPQGAKP